MSEGQPTYVIKMVAKPGQGDTLRRLATEGMEKADASDNWVHCKVDDEPDTTWTFEVFRDEESKSRYEGSELATRLRGEMLGLVDLEQSLRVAVTPYAASWMPASDEAGDNPGSSDPSQPAYIIRMRAKPGSEDKLFELSAKYLKLVGASDTWLKCRQDDDPAVLWTYEQFNDDETKVAYESSEAARKYRPEILELLAEPPMRIAVHPHAATWKTV